MPDITIISAYDALSHRLWREELGDYLTHHLSNTQVRQVVLPDRHFSWRVRGSALTLSRHPGLQQPSDLIIATSMTDLAALKGMNPQLSDTQFFLYFHENQFAFPDRSAEGLVDRQLTTIYSAITADLLLFNSEFNRRTFLEGTSQLLARMPDGVPANIVDDLAGKSRVLPVGLPPADVTTAKTVLSIAWNHRWEHDKGPSLLQEIVFELLNRNLDFQFSLFGKQFRKLPPELSDTQKLLADAGKLKHAGFVENRDDYLRQLAGNNIVLSTAHQEFQGLAIQEAMMRGCTPVVPDALCYPEYVPDQLRYGSATEAVDIIESISHAEGNTPIDLSAYSQQVVGKNWIDVIQLFLDC